MNRLIASLASLIRTYPVTMTISILALLSLASPGLTQWFQTDFGLIRDGQWWRAISGHWTHFDTSHLFWDLLMFVVLSAACEFRFGRGYWAVIAVSLPIITGLIGWTRPEITHYRGLSGIDTGLFVWVAVDFVRTSWTRRQRGFSLAGVAAIAALIGKLIFEANTGQTLFVDSTTFDPLVESHLAGVAVGLVAALVCHAKDYWYQDSLISALSDKPSRISSQNSGST